MNQESSGFALGLLSCDRASKYCQFCALITAGMQKTNNVNQIRRILYCQHSCCYENGKLEKRGWADPGASLAEPGGTSVEKWYA